MIRLIQTKSSENYFTVFYKYGILIRAPSKSSDFLVSKKKNSHIFNENVRIGYRFLNE